MPVVQGANAVLMFVLELGVLAAAIRWGLTLDAPVLVRILAAVGAVTVFVVVWALFGAANDARYPQTGFSRAALELVWFGGAAVLLGWSWSWTAALVFFAVWALNYGLRLLWHQV